MTLTSLHTIVLTVHFLIRLLEHHAPFDEIEQEARAHKLRTREVYQKRINNLALAPEGNGEGSSGHTS